MSALEGEGSEDPNMAVGRSASSYACATPSRSPGRSPRPRPSGRAVRAGVFRQMVQHVLLALLLGHGAPGVYKMRMHFSSLNVFGDRLCSISVGDALPGDVQELPEKKRHGRAAAHRLRRRRGGQMPEEEAQGSHVHSPGGEIPSLRDQV